MLEPKTDDVLLESNVEVDDIEGSGVHVLKTKLWFVFMYDRGAVALVEAEAELAAVGPTSYELGDTEERDDVRPDVKLTDEADG